MSFTTYMLRLFLGATLLTMLASCSYTGGELEPILISRIQTVTWNHWETYRRKYPRTKFLSAQFVDQEMMNEVLTAALRQKGGDSLVDYKLSVTTTQVPLLPIYTTTLRVSGTAVKMTIGQETFEIVELHNRREADTWLHGFLRIVGFFVLTLLLAQCTGVEIPKVKMPEWGIPSSRYPCDPLIQPQQSAGASECLYLASNVNCDFFVDDQWMIKGNRVRIPVTKKEVIGLSVGARWLSGEGKFHSATV